MAKEISIQGPNFDHPFSERQTIEHKILPLSAHEKKQSESLIFKAKTRDNRQIIFVPFNGSQEHINGLITIVNHPKVYPTLRHMKEWWPELIGRTAKRYVNGIRNHLRALSNKPFVYTPAALDICWVAYVDGKIVARGGLQKEEGDITRGISPATEIYCAVHPDYQNQGIATKLVKIAIAYYDSLHTKVPLRALIMNSNTPSKRIVEKIKGFKDTGHQMTIARWGNSTYAVLERH